MVKDYANFSFHPKTTKIDLCTWDLLRPIWSVLSLRLHMIIALTVGVSNQCFISVSTALFPQHGTFLVKIQGVRVTAIGSHNRLECTWLMKNDLEWIMNSGMTIFK